MSSTKMLSVLALASFLGISGVTAIPSYADPAYAAVAPANHAPDLSTSARVPTAKVSDGYTMALTEDEQRALRAAVPNGVSDSKIYMTFSRSQLGGLIENTNTDCMGQVVEHSSPLPTGVNSMYLSSDAIESYAYPDDIVDKKSGLIGENDLKNPNYFGSWKCDFTPTADSVSNVAIGGGHFFSVKKDGYETVVDTMLKRSNRYYINSTRITGMQPGVYVYRDRNGDVDSVLVVRRGPQLGLKFSGFEGTPGDPSWNPQIQSLVKNHSPWVRYTVSVEKAGTYTPTLLADNLTVEALNTKVQEALQSFEVGDSILVDVDKKSFSDDYLSFYLSMFDGRIFYNDDEMDEEEKWSRALRSALESESYKIEYSNDSMAAYVAKTPQVVVSKNEGTSRGNVPRFYEHNFKDGIPVEVFKLNPKPNSALNVDPSKPEKAPTITGYWMKRKVYNPYPSPASGGFLGGIVDYLNNQQQGKQPDYGPIGPESSLKSKTDADFVVESVKKDRLIGEPVDLTNKQDPVLFPAIENGAADSASFLVQYDYGNFSIFKLYFTPIEEKQGVTGRGINVESGNEREQKYSFQPICDTDEDCQGVHKVTLPDGIDPHSLTIGAPTNGAEPFIKWNPDNQTLTWKNEGATTKNKWAYVLFYGKDKQTPLHRADIYIKGQPMFKTVNSDSVHLTVGEDVNIPILKWNRHYTPEDLTNSSDVYMRNMISYMASRGVSVNWGTKEDPYVRLVGKVEKPVEQYPDVDRNSKFSIGKDRSHRMHITFSDDECDPSTWGFRGPGEGVGLPDYDPIDVPVGDMVMGKAMTVAAGDSETDHAVADRQVPEHCNADDGGSDAPPGDTSTEQPNLGPGDGATESPDGPQPEPSIPGKPPVGPVVPQPPVPLPQPVPQPAPVPAPSKPKPVPSEQPSPKPPLTDDEVGKIVGLPDWDTLYGESRHHTTTNTFRAIFKDKKASTVFVVRDNNPTDALGALSYAVANDIPILQTNPDVLSHKTKDYLDDLVEPNAKVIILGGHEAVRPGVEAELKRLGYTVERFGGETRVETFKKFLAYTGYPALKAPTYELDDATVLDSALTRRGISFETGGALSEKKPITHTYRPGDRVTALYYASVKSLRTEAARADK